MSVLQSIYVDPTVEAQRVKGKPQADGRPAPTWLESADANIELQQDRSGYNRALAFSEAYKNLEDGLDDAARARIAEKFRSAGIIDRQTGRMPAQDAGGIVAYRQKIIWAEVEQARQSNPKSFANVPVTMDQYDGTVHQRLVTNRTKNKDVANREDGWSAGLLGGMAGSLSDPINAASMFVGGPATGFVRQVLVGGLVNMATEAATIPGANDELGYLGDSETAQQQVNNVLMAGGVGVAFPTTIKIGGKTIDLGLKGAKMVGGKLIDAAGKYIPLDLRIAKAMGKESIDQVDDRQIAEIFAQAIPSEYRTPAQADALTMIERQGQVKAANPYRDTYTDIDAHLKKADEALARVSSSIVTGRVPAAPAATASSIANSGANFGRVKALIRGPESGGNDAATNALGSSASGRYQFIESTFKSIYKRVYGGDADVAWNSKRRFDVQVQERLMDRLLADNAAVLQRQGAPVSDGNLYVMHVLGSGNGPLLLRSDPNADVASIIRAANPKTGNAIVRQNPAYFGGGKTVGQALATIRGKVGANSSGGAQEIPQGSAIAALPDGEDIPFVRPAALDAVRPVVTTEGRPVALQAFKPSDIDVDANLMQFKSGGDAQGVTERLRGRQQWDPYSAGVVTVWESSDGRRLIADGHQRHGLATRLSAADPSQDIQLNAFVLREADGVSAADARIITALRNISEGSGTVTDAAKIFREGGKTAEDALARRLPPRSALVRDGNSLSRLSDEAFGAVVNEVVPESWGAVIGELAPDPTTHMALIDLLTQLNPPNRRQAASIVRQAMDAGFARETQEELFGSRDVATALFASRAKILDRGLTELRKLKGVFQVAGRNSETLAGEGSQINVARADAAAQGNAVALEILERLAHRKGDVSDLLNSAAQKLSQGQSLASVVAQFVGDVRKLDLDALGRADGPAGGYGNADGGSRSFGALDDEIQSTSGDQLGPDGLERYRNSPAFPDGEPLDAGGLTPSERATLEYEEPGLGLFDDPVGEGPKAFTDTLGHDLKAQAIDDPMVSVAFAAREGADETTEQVLKSVEIEEAALKALRECL